MSHVSRCASAIGAPLILAALLGSITPAGALIAANGVSINGVNLNGVSVNGRGVNGLSSNGHNLNGLSMNGSALGDLNGVAVEAVIVPDAALR